MIKIEFKEAQCIKDFHSLDGKVVFQKGETYTVNKFGGIDNKGYRLHSHDQMLLHFIFIANATEV